MVPISQEKDWIGKSARQHPSGGRNAGTGKDPTREAYGVVVEAQLDKGRGPVMMLVQNGTLHVGDGVWLVNAGGKCAL